MSESILEHFHEELEMIIRKENSSHLQRSTLGIMLCNETISKLKEMIEQEDFEDVPAEINFFKKIKPVPMSYLIYFTEIRSAELRKPVAGINYQERFLEKELRRVNKFFFRNVDFVHYMEQGYTYLDHQLFTRNSRNDFPFTPTINYYQYPEFSTSHDMLWAKIKAMYSFIHYLREQDQELKPGNFNLPKEKRHKVLLWTASKTSLIELIYALYSDGAINHGTADLSTITSSFEDFFNIKLDNIYKTYAEIKGRKGSKTKFLDELMVNLQQKMNREDCL